MLRILDVTFPFFGLVLLGWAATRRGWLPLEAIPGLNQFVLYFALPCMLFRFAAATPVARMVDPGVAGTWLLCALAMVALAMVLTRRGRTGWNDAAFGALVAAFSNSGFMGVPLLVDLMGPRAAAPAIVTLAIDMVITSSLCIALSRLGDAGAQGAGQAVRNALKGMAANPLPWAIASGCLVSACGLEVPSLLMKPVAMTAAAASPTALFVLGAVLARSQLQARQRTVAPAVAADRGHTAGGPGARTRHPRDDVPLIVTLKLALHPLLVWAACRGAVALGVPVDPFAAQVLVLVAALPAASNVPMLAERFGADAGRIARVVLWSTVVAFASFTAAVALLAAQPGSAGAG